MSLSPEELSCRLAKIRQDMSHEGCESLLLRSIPSQLYLTGSVVSGWIYVSGEGEPVYFPDRTVNRLSDYDPARVIPVRKPEQIPAALESLGYRIDQHTALEKSYLTQVDYERLSKLAPSGVSSVDAGALMRQVRMTKTQGEIRLIRETAARHSEIYEIAPQLYEPGMTDLEWQYALEYEMRKRGWVGLFRTFGTQMESFSGSVIAGDNASCASPYDFTMGGRGVASFPLGAAGHVIRPGESVMVDLAGDYTQYQSDCTRTYYVGTLPDEAFRCHEISLRMHEWLEEVGEPGFPIGEIYNHCLHLAEQFGVADHFMGDELRARYVGHGVGLEINELPILTGRWPGVLEEGMVIAFEPKIILPGVGALGIEDTYLVLPDGLECLTTPERTLVKLC